MSSSLLTKALTALTKAAPNAAAPRAFSAVVAGASFKLPDLPYDAGALEPFISGEIMKVRRAARAGRACVRGCAQQPRAAASRRRPPRRSTTQSTTMRT